MLQLIAEHLELLLFKLCKVLTTLRSAYLFGDVQNRAMLVKCFLKHFLQTFCQRFSLIRLWLHERWFYSLEIGETRSVRCCLSNTRWVRLAGCCNDTLPWHPAKPNDTLCYSVLQSLWANLAESVTEMLLLVRKLGWNAKCHYIINESVRGLKFLPSNLQLSPLDWIVFFRQIWFAHSTWSLEVQIWN